MKTFILASTLTLLCSCSTTYYVRDAKMKPIKQATVIVTRMQGPAEAPISSDHDGEFALRDGDNKVKIIKVVKIGYRTKSLYASDIHKNKNVIFLDKERK